MIFDGPLDLGILYKGEEIINHRSLLKVLVNPVLRSFGLCIGTVYHIEEKRLGGLRWSMEHNECDRIVRKRMIV